MTARERFLRCALGQDVDRPPFWLYWSPWGRAWQRWCREGKPDSVTDHRSPWQPDAPPAQLPVNLGPCPGFDREVLAEDERAVTWVDPWGIVRRDLKDNESMSQFLSWPVRGRDDWERYRRERLDPQHPDRLSGGWRDRAAEWTAAGTPIQLCGWPVGIYGALRWLLGDEESLVAFYTDPELVHDICTHITDLLLTVFEQVVAAGVRVDVIHIWEDLCGRQGPLMSPATWTQFVGPSYTRIAEFADRHHIPVISVDSDGDPRALVPVMMDHGVNYLYPLEVAAGCDVHEFRKRWPDLAVHIRALGNIVTSVNYRPGLPPLRTIQVSII